MDSKIELELKAKYPKFFHDMYNPDNPRSCMNFGLDCGAGWREIIEEAASKIEPLIEKWLQENTVDEWWNQFPRASQIKEKFGSLRLYLSGGTDEIYKIVNEAEAKSSNVCEECGKVGKNRARGTWYVTLCEEHWDDYNRRCDESRKAFTGGRNKEELPTS
jgi:hypothetical protein